MCRTTDYYPRKRFLRLKAISLRLSLSSASAAVSLLPESLTLVFLPRINGGLLEINGSKYQPDSPAFLSLHRVLNSEVVYSTVDRVRACDGVILEIHAAENRLVRGVLRQEDDGELRMECKCELERESGVREVEIVVAAENGGVFREKVVSKRRRRRSKNCRKFEVALEEIPEERESDVVEEEEEEELGVSCCCCCDEIEKRSEGGDGVDIDQMVEMEMESLRWAVDVGVWALCLGVGFFVSRASIRNLRRRKF